MDDFEVKEIHALNSLLTEAFDEVVCKYNSITIKGEIIECKLWKDSLVQFTIKDGDNFMNKFKCIALARNGIDLQLIMSHENTTCIVTGVIKQNYWCGGRDFRLELNADIVFDNDNSKMKELKKICDTRGYFKDKKDIIWSSVKTIGLISKKDTQGYNDFKIQFKMPLNIIEKDIVLEGDNTEETLISAIKDLQNMVDIIFVIRGGGSTMDISSSFDRLSIFECMKQSRVPIITAIGHEADKDDKLLITSISDYDFPTPTRAAIEMNMILKEPYMKKLNSAIELIQKSFNVAIEKMREEEYLKLRCMFDKVIKDKFGGRIIDINDGEDSVIVQHNAMYFKMNIHLSDPININKEDIECMNMIQSGISDEDIHIIEDHIEKFVTDKQMIKLMRDCIRVINNTDKLEDKFAKNESKKIKTLYCKCIQIDKSDCKQLIQLYSMYLWYKSIFEKLDVDNSVLKEVIEFLTE